MKPCSTNAQEFIPPPSEKKNLNHRFVSSMQPRIMNLSFACVWMLNHVFIALK